MTFVRELNGIVLAIDGEPDSLEVKGLAVQDVHRSVHNCFPDVDGEVIHASPLLMSTEVTERFQGVRGGAALSQLLHDGRCRDDHDDGPVGCG